jgi:hypothetical protein
MKNLGFEIRDFGSFISKIRHFLSFKMSLFGAVRMADLRIDRPYLPITGKNPVLNKPFYDLEERERGNGGAGDAGFMNLSRDCAGSWRNFFKNPNQIFCCRNELSIQHVVKGQLLRRFLFPVGRESHCEKTLQTPA